MNPKEFNKIKKLLDKHGNEIVEFYSKYGINNGVGIGANGIVVMFEKLYQGAKPPKEYQGHDVEIKIIGKIRPL